MAEDEGHEDKLIGRLASEAVKNVFDGHLDVKDFRASVDYFESGKGVEVGDTQAGQGDPRAGRPRPRPEEKGGSNWRKKLPGLTDADARDAASPARRNSSSKATSTTSSTRPPRREASYRRRRVFLQGKASFHLRPVDARAGLPDRRARPYECADRDEGAREVMDHTIVEAGGISSLTTSRDELSPATPSAGVRLGDRGQDAIDPHLEYWRRGRGDCGTAFFHGRALRLTGRVAIRRRIPPRQSPRRPSTNDEATPPRMHPPSPDARPIDDRASEDIEKPSSTCHTVEESTSPADRWLLGRKRTSRRSSTPPSRAGPGFDLLMCIRQPLLSDDRPPTRRRRCRSSHDLLRQKIWKYSGRVRAN